MRPGDQQPTPGQVAYHTYERILLQRPPPDVPLLWRLMTALEQEAWEAAAQAVLVDTLVHWRAREEGALRHARAVVEVYRSGWTAPRLVQAIQTLERWLDAPEDTDHA